MISQEQLAKRIGEMGRQITEDFAGKDLLCVGILKGAVPFFTALIQQIRLPLEVDFICVSSYGKKTTSSGTVRMALDILQPIEGKHVLLIEDVIDTGVTFSYLLDTLKVRKPASLNIATLLIKPKKLKCDLDVNYSGFEIGNEFVVGFGLDYAEKYRNMPHIAILPPELIND